MTAHLTGSLFLLRLSFAELKVFFVFCSGKSGITVINPDQKMTNHSGNNCGLINPQQLNSNYAGCCSILWNMMQFEAEQTSELLCQAPFAHMHLLLPLLQPPLSGRTRASADIKHVLFPTTEPQEPNRKENDSTHPCPHFCEVSITARLASRLLPVSLSRTGVIRSGEAWRTRAPTRVFGNHLGFPMFTTNFFF